MGTNNYDNIPQELRATNNWCCWRADPDPSKPGKIKKTPINAKTGGQAQSNNPDTWSWCNGSITVSKTVDESSSLSDYAKFTKRSVIAWVVTEH